MLRDTPAPVPVTVSVDVPVGVELVVATESVEVALAPLEPSVTRLGERVRVALLGPPAADSVTSPVNPPVGDTVIV